MPLTNYRNEVASGRLWPAGTPAGSKPAVVPSYMRGPYMQTLGGSVGAYLDMISEQVMRGRLQAIASAGPPGAVPSRLADGRLIQCEPFVLQLLAAQRGIPLYATEGVQSQRFRIANAALLHRQRGTHRGEFLHALPYFNDFVYDPVTGMPTGNLPPGIDAVFQLASGEVNWHRMSPAGAYSILRPASPNFDWDGRYASNRCRVWYFVRMTGTGFTPPWAYDSGPTYDDGHLYDVGGARPFTAPRMHDVAQMLIDWTAATSWVNLVAFVWDPAAVDPTTSPTQDADGRWSLPNGPNTWAGPVDPGTGKATRPKGVIFYHLDNAP